MPNPAYGGPHAKKVSTIQAVPYTSDTAEFNAVRAGSIDVGYLPLTDIKQVGAVKAEAGFLTQDQPSLVQQNPDYVVVWKKTLSGPQASIANQTQYWPTPEFWYLTK